MNKQEFKHLLNDVNIDNIDDLNDDILDHTREAEQLEKIVIQGRKIA